MKGCKSVVVQEECDVEGGWISGVLLLWSRMMTGPSCSLIPTDIGEERWKAAASE